MQEEGHSPGTGTPGSNSHSRRTLPIWSHRLFVRIFAACVVAGAITVPLAYWLSSHPFLTGAAFVVVGYVLAYLLTRTILDPIQELREGAERLAGGDLAVRLPPPRINELAALVAAFNQMAESLQEQVREAVEQRNQIDVVLGSMVEGVLVTDTDYRIIRCNAASERLLGIQGPDVQGRVLHEAVRSPDMYRMVQDAFSSEVPLEREITIYTMKPRQFTATSTVLRDSESQAIGVLVVLHDITTLRKLERVRSDFVANVSHELKTPITSIKGFVETLLEEGFEDSEKATHFLRIVRRQGDRLNAIIDDLLSLSRLEEDRNRGDIELTERPLLPVLEAVRETCQVRLDEKRVSVDIECAPSLTMRMNEALLEQALVNLIDNAIKYSEEQSTINVRAEIHGDKCQVSVTDHGAGIAAHHLDRLFERFYRVDKARSRKLGGTGLGLAIVKHIALVHGGSVSVESTLGSGSSFTLKLPVTGSSKQP